uniref:Putative kinesin n=1 Tax=Trypanosoma vivax (strain Y486) TaxID=1055687 RepID=G0TTH8_TRYVY|nr:putative kinesin [Trypanosoma vivax Y486]
MSSRCGSKMRRGASNFLRSPSPPTSRASQRSALDEGSVTRRANGAEVVRVAVRVRPPFPSEMGQDMVVTMNPSDKKVYVRDKMNGQVTFSFDMPLWSCVGKAMDGSAPVTQSGVYELVGRPLLTHTLEGFNSTLLVYGPTGSGKTYTLMGEVNAGPPGDSEGSLNDSEEGIIPRFCRDMFKELHHRAAENSGGGTTAWEVSISFVEVYCEKVSDLLNNGAPVLLRDEVVDNETYFGLPGVQRIQVRNMTDVLHLLKVGNKQRKTASTSMNERSSRSHAIFMVELAEFFSVETPDGKVLTAPGKYVTVRLVDLAGCERVGEAGVSGLQFKEGVDINCSLFTLGMVIETLSDPRRRNIKPPYRDSTLTKILKDAFGGNCKTTMICTISPTEATRSYTIHTLNYGMKARHVVNRPQIKEDPLANELRAASEELRPNKKSCLEGCSDGASCDDHSFLLGASMRLKNLENSLREKEAALNKQKAELDEQHRMMDEQRLQHYEKMRMLEEEIERSSAKHRERERGLREAHQKSKLASEEQLQALAGQEMEAGEFFRRVKEEMEKQRRDTDARFKELEEAADKRISDLLRVQRDLRRQLREKDDSNSDEKADLEKKLLRAEEKANKLKEQLKHQEKKCLKSQQALQAQLSAQREQMKKEVRDLLDRARTIEESAECRENALHQKWLKSQEEAQEFRAKLAAMESEMMSQIVECRCEEPEHSDTVGERACGRAHHGQEADPNFPKERDSLEQRGNEVSFVEYGGMCDEVPRESGTLDKHVANDSGDRHRHSSEGADEVPREGVLQKSRKWKNGDAGGVAGGVTLSRKTEDTSGGESRLSLQSTSGSWQYGCGPHGCSDSRARGGRCGRPGADVESREDGMVCCNEIQPSQLPEEDVLSTFERVQSDLKRLGKLLSAEEAVGNCCLQLDNIINRQKGLPRRFMGALTACERSATHGSPSAQLCEGAGIESIRLCSGASVGALNESTVPSESFQWGDRPGGMASVSEETVNDTWKKELLAETLRLNAACSSSHFAAVQMLSSMEGQCRSQFESSFTSEMNLIKQLEIAARTCGEKRLHTPGNEAPSRFSAASTVQLGLQMKALEAEHRRLTARIEEFHRLKWQCDQEFQWKDDQIKTYLLELEQMDREKMEMHKRTEEEHAAKHRTLEKYRYDLVDNVNRMRMGLLRQTAAQQADFIAAQETVQRDHIVQYFNMKFHMQWYKENCMGGADTIKSIERKKEMLAAQERQLHERVALLHREERSWKKRRAMEEEELRSYLIELQEEDERRTKSNESKQALYTTALDSNCALTCQNTHRLTIGEQRYGEVSAAALGAGQRESEVREMERALEARVAEASRRHEEVSAAALEAEQRESEVREMERALEARVAKASRRHEEVSAAALEAEQRESDVREMERALEARVAEASRRHEEVSAAALEAEQRESEVREMERALESRVAEASRRHEEVSAAALEAEQRESEVREMERALEARVAEASRRHEEVSAAALEAEQRESEVREMERALEARVAEASRRHEEVSAAALEAEQRESEVREMERALEARVAEASRRHEEVSAAALEAEQRESEVREMERALEARVAEASRRHEEVSAAALEAEQRESEVREMERALEARVAEASRRHEEVSAAALEAEQRESEVREMERALEARVAEASRRHEEVSAAALEAEQRESEVREMERALEARVAEASRRHEEVSAAALEAEQRESEVREMERALESRVAEASRRHEEIISLSSVSGCSPRFQTPDGSVDKRFFDTRKVSVDDDYILRCNDDTLTRHVDRIKYAADSAIDFDELLRRHLNVWVQKYQVLKSEEKLKCECCSWENKRDATVCRCCGNTQLI